MTKLVFDLEWKVPEDGDVLRDAEHLWCACFKTVGVESWTQFSGESLNLLPKFISELGNPTFIGHNILGADMEMLRRFYGINYTVLPDTIMGNPCTFIDTLTLSRRLWPDRLAVKGTKSIHGLEAWGIRTGVSKPQVHDWSDQPIEVYLNRCREDVLNNEATYEMLMKEQEKLYG